MSDQDKVVITCAVTGALANRKQCPNIPYTPQEIAEEVRRAYEAGATVFHIHGREYDGTPSFRREIFEETAHEVRSRCPKAIINFSTGAIGIPEEQRIEYLHATLPEIAALNFGSLNYAKYSPRRKALVFSLVFVNPFSEIMALCKGMNDVGIKPEAECFDVGHVESIPAFIDMGVLKPPFFSVNLVLGVLGGMAATPDNVLHCARRIPPGIAWGVTPIGSAQWTCVGAAVTNGGHARVGFEDNFYLPNGELANSNGDLVAAAARLVRSVGREVATADEARKILAIDQLDPIRTQKLAEVARSNPKIVGVTH